MNRLLPAGLLLHFFRNKYYLFACLFLHANIVCAQNLPVASISSSPTSACKGEPITFTVAVKNADPVTSYQWQVNGVNTGGNSNKFTTTALNDADVVLCVATTSGANGTSSTLNSNGLTLTIVSPPTIIQQNTSICPGSSLLLQADVSGTAYAKYKPVDFSNQFNFNVSYNSFGRQFVNCPSGNVTFNDVPFIIYPWTAYNGWNASAASGPDPRKLVIPVNEDGVLGINILANTYFGVPGPESYVSASFWANGVVVYKKELIGDFDIRDFNRAQFTNSINNSTTVNAWQTADGQNRLDNVHIQMPTLTRIDSIVFNDHGGNGQRMFVLAATVEKTPLVLKWSTGQVGPSITVNPATPTTYSVLATNGVASCTGSSINVGMKTPVVPVVNIAQSANNVCPGTPITFTATVQNSQTEPGYQWLVNNIMVDIDSRQFTTSKLKTSDVITCKATVGGDCLTTNSPVSNPLTVNLLQPPGVDAGPDVLIHVGDQTQLRAAITGDVLNMQWSPATGLSNPMVANPVATPLVTTKYFLTVQNRNTCVAIDSITIKVLPLDIEIPNAMSPNHDGTNDVWTIKHLDQFTGCTVKIFTRYGQQVFSSVGYAQPWNGTYKNKRLPPATYYYIIDLKDGSRVRSGYVELIY